MLVCTIITLGVKIILKNKLATYEAAAMTAARPQETEEQLIIASEIEETGENAVDLLKKYNDHFEEMDMLYDQTSGMEQDEAHVDAYKKIAGLWDRELKSLGDDISRGMMENEKKMYFDSENTFLVSRNHECMKAVGHDKVSVIEKIDYLDRYIKLTREHCMDLVKDYSSYLAS
ncbi:hypothetical protein SAMN05216356_101130 [Oribacterium sp. WCC10]|nr:hypothetical protein SAMN05216356_101130 [Oribacterium sp. WCC10]